MNHHIERRVRMFRNVRKLGNDNPEILVAPVDALMGQLSVTINEIDHHAGEQIFGAGTFQAGSDERADIAYELKTMLREIAQTARVLDRTLHPGIKEQFRLPKSQSYATLLSTARAHAEAVTPIKASYIARRYPADFVEQLTTLIDKFDVATDRKFGGIHDRVGGTSGLEAASSLGLAVVRDMDAILSRELRLTNPILLRVWKVASRVEKAPVRKKEAPPAIVTPS